MFSYGRDIALLHGAFLSISKNRLNTEDSVRSVLDVLSNPETQSNRSKRRIHAALFVTLIKPAELKDDSFESVQGLFPNLTWPLYFELLRDCTWRDYFLECTELLDSISLNVMLRFSSNYLDNLNRNNSYLLGCIIQVVFLLEPEVEEAFIDNLTTLIIIHFKEPEASKLVLEVLSTLCKKILNEIAPEYAKANKLSKPAFKMISTKLFKWLLLVSTLANAFDIRALQTLKMAYRRANKELTIPCTEFDMLLRVVDMTKNEKIQSSLAYAQFKMIQQKYQKLEISTLEADIVKDILKDFTQLENSMQELRKENNDNHKLNLHVASNTICQLMGRVLKLCMVYDRLDAKELQQLFLDVSSSMHSISNDNKIDLVLENCGVGANRLKTEEYNPKMLLLLNQSHLNCDFQDELLSLCQQSPLETVSKIFEKALESGGQLPVLGQMLLFLKTVCEHRMSDTHNLIQTLIIDSFKKSSDMDTKKKQNLLKLIVHLKSDILDAKELHQYLMNQLSPTSDFEFILAALNEINVGEMDCLNICHLLNISAHLAEQGYIQARQKVSEILAKSLVPKLTPEQEGWIRLQMKVRAKIIQYQSAKVLNYKLEICDDEADRILTAVWIINKKDESLPEARILQNGISEDVLPEENSVVPVNKMAENNRNSLLKMLAKNLLFATNNESLTLFNELVKYFDDEITKSFSVYIDALVIMFHWGSDWNWSYIVKSLGYVLENCLNRVLPLKTVLYLFVEACRFSQKIADLANVQSLVVNMLLQFNNFYAQFDMQDKLALRDIIEVFPDSTLKEELLQKFQ